MFYSKNSHNNNNNNNNNTNNNNVSLLTGRIREPYDGRMVNRVTERTCDNLHLSAWVQHRIQHGDLYHVVMPPWGD